jgi:YHS domain-containing protein
VEILRTDGRRTPGVEHRRSASDGDAQDTRTEHQRARRGGEHRATSTCADLFRTTPQQDPPAGQNWLYRNRERLGGGAGYAIDPVCGMQVQISNSPAHVNRDGVDYWFCSDRCASRFTVEPDRHSSSGGAHEHDHHGPATGSVDPVCGMSVGPDHAAAHRHVDGTDYYFCSEGCAATFDVAPHSATDVARDKPSSGPDTPNR